MLSKKLSKYKIILASGSPRRKRFFEELGIPSPHFNINVGSGSHGKQTAKMIEGIEEILVNEKPDAVILYGDTN